ncbi:hypothetical protein MTO96_023642 [Rhipicephalus appendiculatus]
MARAAKAPAWTSVAIRRRRATLPRPRRSKGIRSPPPLDITGSSRLLQHCASQFRRRRNVLIFIECRRPGQWGSKQVDFWWCRNKKGVKK